MTKVMTFKNFDAYGEVEQRGHLSKLVKWQRLELNATFNHVSSHINTLIDIQLIVVVAISITDLWSVVAQWYSVGLRSEKSGLETYHRRVVSLSKTLYSQKILVKLRKQWLRPVITEKLLTGTLSINTNKQTKSLLIFIIEF